MEGFAFLSKISTRTAIVSRVLGESSDNAKSYCRECPIIVFGMSYLKVHLTKSSEKSESRSQNFYEYIENSRQEYQKKSKSFSRSIGSSCPDFRLSMLSLHSEMFYLF